MPDNWINRRLLTSEDAIYDSNGNKINDLIDTEVDGGEELDDEKYPVLYSKLGGSQGDKFWGSVVYYVSVDNRNSSTSLIASSGILPDASWNSNYASDITVGFIGDGITYNNAAYHFVSTNTYKDFEYGTAGTLDFYFKTNGETSADSFYSNGYRLTLNNGFMNLIARGGDSALLSWEVPDDDFHHYAIVRDDTGKFFVFVDGVLVVEDATISVDIGGSSSKVNVGNWVNITSVIDQIRYTNAVRYSSDFTPPSSEYDYGELTEPKIPTLTRPTGSPNPYKIVADATED